MKKLFITGLFCSGCFLCFGQSVRDSLITKRAEGLTLRRFMRETAQYFNVECDLTHAPRGHRLGGGVCAVSLEQITSMINGWGICRIDIVEKRKVIITRIK
jgi:hypothetical protein